MLGFSLASLTTAELRPAAFAVNGGSAHRYHQLLEHEQEAVP